MKLVRHRLETAGGRPGRRSEEGIALALVLVMTAVALLMVASVMWSSSTTSRVAWSSIAHSKALAASDAALEAAISSINYDFVTFGSAAVSNKVASGTYIGPVTAIVTQQVSGLSELNLSITALSSTNLDEMGFSIEAEARVADLGINPGVSEMKLIFKDRPITRYSYYYEVDLEHYTWHDWNVTGPVYCASNAYFRPTSASTLTFEKDVRVSGKIVIGPHPLEPDARAPDDTVEFEAESLADARPPMRPPAPSGESNGRHWVLEKPVTADYGTPTGNERFYNKADVILLVGNSSVQVLTGPKYGGSLFSTAVPACANTNSASLFDGREGVTAYLTLINAAEVRNWVVSVLGGATPAHPIVYVADERTTQPRYGVMITNALTLPGGGFTLATPNPLYLRGHFNLNTPQPALLAADAITVLSSLWNNGIANDGNPSNNGGDGSLDINSDSNRDAVNTTVNASIVTGIVAANGSYGSGWVANVLRLLEDWSGTTLTFNGSTAVLFLSERATGAFSCCNYYKPPAARNFSFVDYTESFPASGRTNLLGFKLPVRTDYR